MTLEPDRLEHLFSRYIDGECTADEQQLLRSLIRRVPEVRSRFEDYQQLDQRVGDAVRDVLGRPNRAATLRAYWTRVGRSIAVAVAAGLAALAWLQPPPPAAPSAGDAPRQAGVGSWFAPAVPPGDMIEPLPTAYERPELRVRGTQRDWIVLPADEPNTYLVIEVNHVRTHVIGVQRDF